MSQEISSEFVVCSSRPELSVNRLGHVKLTDNYVLGQSKMNSGYLAVNLNHRKVLVHQLVAEAFVPKQSEEDKFLIHIDGNKENNRFDNLKWVNRMPRGKQSDPEHVKALPEGAIAIETINKHQFKDLFYHDKLFYKKLDGDVYRVCTGTPVPRTGLTSWNLGTLDKKRVVISVVQFLFEYPEFKKDFNISDKYVPPIGAVKIDSISGVKHDHLYYFNKFLYIRFRIGLSKYSIVEGTTSVKINGKWLQYTQDSFLKEHPEFMNDFY